MVYVKKKDRETTASLLRRFTRRVQQSGVLIEARKLKSYKGKPTKRVVRDRALRRIIAAKERVRLDKLGKLEERKK